jgi:hypothetical protein
MHKYKYVRRTIRNLGFISTFMGTKASITNFVSLGLNADSNDCEETILSYVVFKLTQKLPDCLLNLQNNAKNLILKQFENNEGISERLNIFVNQITKMLKIETQLFCQYLFDYLSDYLTLEANFREKHFN